MNEVIGDSGAIGVDLEAPEPAPVVAAVEPVVDPPNPLPSTVAAQPAEVPDEDDQALANETVELEHQGQKARLVSEGAIKAVRTKLKNKVLAADARTAEALQRAERAEQVAAQATQTLTAWQQNPNLVNRAAATVPVSDQQAAPQVDDAEYELLAKTMELYDEQGKPDLKRARIMEQFFDRRAQKAASTAVAPLHHHTAQEKATSHLATLREQVQAGAYTEDVLNAVTGAMPAEMLASPQAAYIVHLTARGLQQEVDAKNGKKPAPVAVAAQPAIVAQPVAGAPLVTESPTRRPAFAAPTGMLAYVMREKGIGDADARKLLGDTDSPAIALE